jgi:murein DD-endopeptidase MepM/ murein hydrolase activator NlpD
MKYILLLFSIWSLISCSCQKSSDESVGQIKDLEKQHTERLKHLPSISPIEGAKIVNQFGHQVGSQINKGIDIAVENETDVVAVADGKALTVKKGMANGENLIIIDHGYGIQTKYSNLAEILAEANQAVKRWTVIGKMKRTTDQPALLHYEVIKDGENVDPERFIF